ncbi:MAG: hypothetical protein EP298_01935 [Gammaproteobacteria bacterium]|nr:MAG: hypothetical protein EP298_01935 [Gammaproteobacteria bacterium]UTW41399.1 hypothetical protein KFE69_07705 [bacterium SCSIO 12844]
MALTPAELRLIRDQLNDRQQKTEEIKKFIAIIVTLNEENFKKLDASDLKEIAEQLAEHTKVVQENLDKLNAAENKQEKDIEQHNNLLNKINEMYDDLGKLAKAKEATIVNPETEMGTNDTKLKVEQPKNDGNSELSDKYLSSLSTNISTALTNIQNKLGQGTTVATTKSPNGNITSAVITNANSGVTATYTAPTQDTSASLDLGTVSTDVDSDKGKLNIQANKTIAEEILLAQNKTVEQARQDEIPEELIKQDFVLSGQNTSPVVVDILSKYHNIIDRCERIESEASKQSITFKLNGNQPVLSPVESRARLFDDNGNLDLDSILKRFNESKQPRVIKVDSRAALDVVDQLGLTRDATAVFHQTGIQHQQAELEEMRDNFMSSVSQPSYGNFPK